MLSSVSPRPHLAGCRYWDIIDVPKHCYAIIKVKQSRYYNLKQSLLRLADTNALLRPIQAPVIHEFDIAALHLLILLRGTEPSPSFVTPTLRTRSREAAL